MSSSQYLRNKMASMPRVLNTMKPQDASDITTKKRLSNSRFFPINGGDKGTLREASDMETSKGKATISTQKSTGQPKDSSDFTAFRGAVGINKDLAYYRGRLVDCNSRFLDENLPQTFTAGERTALTVANSGSDFVRQKLQCAQQRVPHTTGQVGPALFVDDTIRLRPVDSSCSTCIPSANHEIKANVPFERTTNGPTKFSTLPHQEPNNPPYKSGGLIHRSKYIEKHHGNDLNVNPQRPFVKYQGSDLPLQRLDKPRFGDVKP
jgi:hypothetical protein